MDLRKRCIRWSDRVQLLLVTLLLVHLAVIVQVVIGVKGDGAFSDWSVTLWLVTLWTVWLLLQVSNYRLVKCGPQEVRWELSPRFINRPNFYARLSSHVLVNWSVIITTLGVAWMLESYSLSTALVWISLWATVLVWGSFNVLHRRINRFRNLLLSTSGAVLLLIVCLQLLGIRGLPN